MMTTFFQKKSFLFKLRLVWMSLILVIIVVFLFFKVVPFGRATYSKNYTNTWSLGKGFIYNFTPVNKVDIKSGRLPRLLGTPIYFSVFTPRTFSKAKLTIKYKSKLKDMSGLEAGSLIDPSTFYYNLKPLISSGPDSLSAEFDLKGAYRINGKYGFAISLPALELDDDSSDYLEISEVKVEFIGRTIQQKIFGIKD